MCYKVDFFFVKLSVRVPGLFICVPDHQFISSVCQISLSLCQFPFLSITLLLRTVCHSFMVKLLYRGLYNRNAAHRCLLQTKCASPTNASRHSTNYNWFKKWHILYKPYLYIYIYLNYSTKLYFVNFHFTDRDQLRIATCSSRFF